MTDTQDPKGDDSSPSPCSDSLMRINVCQEVWLVPQSLITMPFMNAVRKMNNASHGEIIEWSNQEKQAFREIWDHPYVWRPF